MDLSSETSCFLVVGGFTPSESQGFTSLAKVLKPLEVLASSGAQPTLSSILGDAIDYLKELLQRISDLHNELESTPTPPGSFPPTPSSFHLLTPTTQILSFPVKEELHLPFCLYPQVEVRLREGSAVNIHMFCGRRPGLLLATMKALDNLGLDVQQAVISCFNGFALDVFCAERSHECYVCCLYVMSVCVQVTRFLFKSQAYGFGSFLLLYI
ncbi:hypothetical protein Bca52824_080954 [Brassica carinata]|uniref:Plant bHLH transcription factor ACT-like domain-containing protein n=1 Tax=Brassica carinata TaxID=52824 RepID=A0A8X7PHQ8_BRACI|nr:hypothetical protein Bca52824_080954 [Brassica carinata]